MSEAKFVVGQWVTRKGVNWKVKEVRLEGDTLLLEGYGGAYVDDCIPFVWQVGKTYKTTIDGVTATVNRIGIDDTVYGTASCSLHGTFAWTATTGLMFGYEDDKSKPNLLPYLADEPPPVAEAATYSEFEEADEGDEPDALQSLLAEFGAERRACELLVEKWTSRVSTWKQAEQSVIEKIERAKR